MKNKFNVMIEYKDVDNELYGPVYKAIKKLTKRKMGGHGTYLPTRVQDIDFNFSTEKEAKTFMAKVKKIKGIKRLTLESSIYESVQ